MESNWAENLTYEAAEFAEPATIEEVQQRVADATKVRAIGTRHSFNAIADSPGGLLLSTAGLGIGVVVDSSSMTATVPAGWSYSAVNVALESNGVALANLGSLPHISVGGAMATGTHGSGDTNQILSGDIAGVEVVTADGSLLSINRAAPEFKAVAVGLGAFGIITTLTLNVLPTYQVRQEIYRNASWATVLANLDEIMASAYSVNLHADFGSDNIRRIWQKHRLDDNNPAGPVVDELWGATRLTVAEPEPGRVTTIGVVGPWHERLPHFTPEGAPSAGGDELQTEYFVDRTDAVAALGVLRGMADKIDPHLHGTEIRTVSADDLWMSPTQGRHCLAIGFTWKKHVAEVAALLPEIEAALESYAPTPHWGKLFAMDRDCLASRVRRLDEFADMVDNYDKTAKFANPFSRRLLARPQ